MSFWLDTFGFGHASDCPDDGWPRHPHL